MYKFYIITFIIPLATAAVSPGKCQFLRRNSGSGPLSTTHYYICCNNCNENPNNCSAHTFDTGSNAQLCGDCGQDVGAGQVVGIDEFPCRGCANQLAIESDCVANPLASLPGFSLLFTACMYQKCLIPPSKDGGLGNFTDVLTTQSFAIGNATPPTIARLDNVTLPGRVPTVHPNIINITLPEGLDITTPLVSHGNATPASVGHVENVTFQVEIPTIQPDIVNITLVADLDRTTLRVNVGNATIPTVDRLFNDTRPGEILTIQPNVDLSSLLNDASEDFVSSKIFTTVLTATDDQNEVTRPVDELNSSINAVIATTTTETQDESIVTTEKLIETEITYHHNSEQITTMSKTNYVSSSLSQQSATITNKPVVTTEIPSKLEISTGNAQLVTATDKPVAITEKADDQDFTAQKRNVTVAITTMETYEPYTTTAVDAGGNPESTTQRDNSAATIESENNITTTAIVAPTITTALFCIKPKRNDYRYVFEYLRALDLLKLHRRRCKNERDSRESDESKKKSSDESRDSSSSREKSKQSRR